MNAPKRRPCPGNRSQKEVRPTQRWCYFTGCFVPGWTGYGPCQQSALQGPSLSRLKNLLRRTNLRAGGHMLRIQSKHGTTGPKVKSHQREAYLDWAIIALFNNSVLLTIALVMPPLAILLPASLVLGFGFAMGVITVLHNAGHHRYSQRYWPNMLVVHSAVPVGLWVAHWTLKHRVHHKLPAAYPDDAFTQAGPLRLHPLAPHRPF